MGAQIAKELGVYNEEEKICTPKNVGLQKYRLLTNDPRSATAGITRTPIQVECSPTGVKSLPRGKLIINTEDISSEEIVNKKQEEHDSGYKEEGELSCELKEDIKRNSSGSVKYLETDIDKVDSPVLSCNSPPKHFDTSSTDIHHSTLITQEKPEQVLAEVPSPAIQITSTPELVECTPELFALQARIDSLSFCDFDIHSEDPSVVVSDDDQSIPHNQSTVNQWLVGVENKGTPGNDSFADSPKTVAKKQKELNALKKQLFFTPDVRIAEPAKPKARTPLGNLQAGQLQESPQRVMKAKQWRNIAEERKRRGLIDTENTPPNLALPPLMAVASAPSKIVEHKRTKINWDSENAMLI